MTEITNTVWRIDGDRYVSTIRDASMGGRNVLYDPWGREIPNTALSPVWGEGDCGPEITAWTCTVLMDGGIANLYMANT